jgi:hypothetical protein
MTFVFRSFRRNIQEILYPTIGVCIALAAICLGIQWISERSSVQLETLVPLDRVKLAAFYLAAPENATTENQWRYLAITPVTGTRPISTVISLKTYPITALTDDKIQGSSFYFYANFKSLPFFLSPGQKVTIYFNGTAVHQIAFDQQAMREGRQVYLPSAEFLYTEINDLRASGLLRPLYPYTVAFPLGSDKLELLSGMDPVTLEFSQSDFDGVLESISILLLYPVSYGPRSLIVTVLFAVLAVAMALASWVFLDIRFVRPITSKHRWGRALYLYLLVVFVLCAITEDVTDLYIFKRIAQYFHYLGNNPLLIITDSPAGYWLMIMFAAPFVLLKEILPAVSDLLFVLCLKTPLFLSYLWTAYLLNSLLSKLNVAPRTIWLGVVIYLFNPVILFNLFWGQRDLIAGAVVLAAVYAFLSEREYVSFAFGSLAFFIKEYSLAYILAFMAVTIFRPGPPMWKRIRKVILLGTLFMLMNLFFQSFIPSDAIANNIRFRSGYGTFFGATYLTFLYKQGLFNLLPSIVSTVYFPIAFGLLGGASLFILRLRGVLRERRGIIIYTVCLFFALLLTYPRIATIFLAAPLPVLIVLAATNVVPFWYVNLYWTLALFDLFTFYGLWPQFWLSRTLLPMLNRFHQGMWGTLPTGERMNMGIGFAISLTMFFFIVLILMNQLKRFPRGRTDKKQIPLFILGISLLFLIGGVNQHITKGAILYDLVMILGVPGILYWYTNHQLNPNPDGSVQEDPISKSLFLLFSLTCAGYYLFLATSGVFSSWSQILYKIIFIAVIYVLLSVWRGEYSVVSITFWISIFSSFVIVASVFANPLPNIISVVSYTMLLFNVFWFCLIIGRLRLQERSFSRRMLR